MTFNRFKQWFSHLTKVINFSDFSAESAEHALEEAKFNAHLASRGFEVRHKPLLQDESEFTQGRYKDVI